MFENKTSDLSTSPPSRGRSPADSDASIHSRPVSKVRASFVAVERPRESGQGQQWGLRKASEVSSMADFKGEGTNGSSTPQEIEKDSFAAEMAENSNMNKTSRDIEKSDGIDSKKSPGDKEATPKQVIEGDSSRDTIGLGAILKGSAFDPSPTSKAPITATTSVADTTSLSSQYENGEQSTAPHSSPAAAKVKDTMKRPHPLPIAKLVASKDARPAKPLLTRQLPAKASTKSLPISKAPRTPVKANAGESGAFASAQTTATGEPDEKSPRSSKNSPPMSKRAQRASLLPATTKATLTSRIKTASPPSKSNGVNEASQSSPKNKSRPRSPTRPNRLPASATAPKGASLARSGEATNRSPSRNSNTATRPEKNLSSLKREKPSASAVSSDLASAVPKKTPRVSLSAGANAQQKPKPRTSVAGKAPDEGFLARMTRPTTSSAQKTHDKVQVNSPPRENRTKSVPKGKARAFGNIQNDKENKVATEGEDKQAEVAEDANVDAAGKAGTEVPDPPTELTKPEGLVQC